MDLSVAKKVAEEFYNEGRFGTKIEVASIAADFVKSGIDVVVETVSKG
ncbi:hypothetical protein [Streptomyces vinaceus]